MLATRMRRFLLMLGCGLILGLVSRAAEPGSIPILVDTDIGTDIDDAFALALMIKSPEFQLLGVTTVSGDTMARARLAAKLLWTAGGAWREIPVFAGIAGPPQPIDQAAWADGFTSPVLHRSGGLDFLRAQIDAAPGKVTLVALGELTNIAALLQGDAQLARKIKGIALMGGSVYRGYRAGSPPVAEYNFKSNIAAARAVFAARVPILMAPLDSTIGLRLDESARAKIFGQWDPIGQALKQLYALWQPSDHYNQGTPILYDALPFALLIDDRLATILPRTIKVDAAGMSVVVPAGKGADCRVAVASDSAKVLEWIDDRLAP